MRFCYAVAKIFGSTFATSLLRFWQHLGGGLATRLRRLCCAFVAPLGRLWQRFFGVFAAFFLRRYQRLSASWLRVYGAFAALLLRLWWRPCYAFAASLQRLCYAFAAHLLRLWGVLARPVDDDITLW